MGVKELNEQLEHLLGYFTQIPTSNPDTALINFGVDRLVGEMNTLLYCAIDEDPVNATAIEVLAKRPQREEWKKYLSKSNHPDGQVKVVKNLPYKTEHFDHQTIKVAVGYPGNLVVDLGVPKGEKKLTLHSDEIESVKFVDVDKFGVGSLYNGVATHVPLSAESHYLRYRGFLNDNASQKDVPNKEWKADVCKHVERVAVPGEDLLKINGMVAVMGIGSLTGSFVVSRDYDPSLYEILEGKIPFVMRNSPMEVIAAYNVSLIESDTIRAAHYKGKQIIERLHGSK